MELYHLLFVIAVVLTAIFALLDLSLSSQRKGALSEKTDPSWRTDDDGKSKRLYRGKHITVFETADGWKYCFEDVHISEPYQTRDVARLAAILHIESQWPRHSLPGR